MIGHPAPRNKKQKVVGFFSSFEALLIAALRGGLFEGGGGSVAEIMPQGNGGMAACLSFTPELGIDLSNRSTSTIPRSPNPTLQE